MGSIGSVVVCNAPCDLFAKPVSGVFEDLEQALMTLLNDEDMKKVAAQVYVVHASNKQCVTKQYLSKIWFANEELAKGATEQNTQLLKHNADNNLSRHFSTNDRMLRYKRLKSIFSLIL